MGSNGNGQLGLGHDDDTMRLQECYLPGEESVKGLIADKASQQPHPFKFAAGGNHTVLLRNGKLYGTGANSCGQLGEQATGSRWLKFIELVHPPKCSPFVQDVACTWSSTLILTNDNRLFVRGEGYKGELGIAGLVSSAGDWKEITGLPKFDETFRIYIYGSLQNYYLIAINLTDDSCRVFGWGSNTKCQINKPKSRRIDEPLKFFDSNAENDCSKITQLSLGKDFVILLDSNNKIITMQGNIPIGPESLQTTKPKILRCMWTSVHILPDTETSLITGYGNNRYGQLLKEEDTAAKIMKGQEIVTFQTGSEHATLVTQEIGKENSFVVWAWGWGEHGNCGTFNKNYEKGYVNDLSNIVSPLNKIMTCKDKPILFNGCANTWVITQDDNVCIC